MTDDLRTRIAAALKAEDEKPHTCPFDGEPTMASYDRLADAVIRKLGIRQEWGVLDEEFSGMLSDEGPDDLKVVGDGETILTRWITEWEPLDE